MTDPTKPTKLEHTDIIQLENFFLKIQNFKMQGDKAVAEAKHCQQLMLEEQTKLKTFRDSLDDKYGVKVSECHIEADGTLKPGVRMPPGIPQG
jgi:hypothetical protein